MTSLDRIISKYINEGSDLPEKFSVVKPGFWISQTDEIQYSPKSKPEQIQTHSSGDRVSYRWSPLKPEPTKVWVRSDSRFLSDPNKIVYKFNFKQTGTFYKTDIEQALHDGVLELADTKLDRFGGKTNKRR